MDPAEEYLKKMKVQSDIVKIREQIGAKMKEIEELKKKIMDLKAGA